MTEVIKRMIPLGIKLRAHKLQTHAQAFRGKYLCPVCNSRVAAFQPLPDFYAENLTKHGWRFTPEEAETCNHPGYLCPFCEASDRDRLCALYLGNYLMDVKSGDPVSIVDFAPSAPLAKFIRKQIAGSKRNIFYRTADAFTEGVDDQVDITNMQIYNDGQFDFFICSHVLEHVIDDRKALKELHRILKPGGRGILMVPIILSVDEIDEDPTLTDEGERWRRFGQFDHVRLYSKKGFIERVQNAGFRIQECGRKFFGESLLVKTGITSQSVLYVVEKAGSSAGFRQGSPGG